MVDERDIAMDALRQCHENGWIDLARTDTMDTELLKAEEHKQSELLAESCKYVEVLGPLVMDQSRLNHSVRGSSQDEDRIDTVFSVLFPGADRNATTPNNMRDAMHVATAIRYAYTGFVTRERRLLNKAAAVRAKFDSFLMVDPEAAVEIVRRRIATQSTRRS